MTATAGSSEQIEAYLAAVRASLSDLAEDERADLLAEVEASLIESASDIESPFAALGPPEAFAAELRASAGLGEPRTADAQSPSALAVARVFLDDLRRRFSVVTALPIARELAPVWWAVRGYLVVVAVVVATGTWWSRSRPWLPEIATPRTGAIVILIAVAVSLAFGVLRRRHPSSLVLVAIAIDVVALVAIVPAVRHITKAPDTTTYSAAQPVVPASRALVRRSRADERLPLLARRPPAARRAAVRRHWTAAHGRRGERAAAARAEDRGGSGGAQRLSDPLLPAGHDAGPASERRAARARADARHAARQVVADTMRPCAA